MYLYIVFFSDEKLKNGRFYSSGNFLDPIKQKVPIYIDLHKDKIKGCIAYLKGKEYQDISPFIVDVKNVVVNEFKLELYFDVVEELGITNEQLGKQIYHYSRKNDLIDEEFKYPPNLLILNKADFDTIRKGEVKAKRISSKTAKIDEFKLKYNWKAIVDIFEPLKKLENNDSWDNEMDLSELAFACSKLSELKNGMERDQNHLSYIKKYREYCFKIYNRCIELDPDNFRFPSGIAYRYYQSVFELTRQKGRKDGNAKDEIENALHWFNKSLDLYPSNIKDLSRKGYLILEKKLENMKYTNKDWNREFFLEFELVEKEGLESLNKVFEIYERHDENNKKRYRKEYIKSLYRVSKYLLKKVKDPWNEYSCSKIINKPVTLQYSKIDYENIVTAHELMKKCIMNLTNYNIDDIDYVKEELFKDEFWIGSPIDILSHIGNIYMYMFLIKKQLKNNDMTTDGYRDLSIHYLNEAIKAGYRLKGQGTNRNTWFVTERIGRYHIINDDYKEAIRLLEKARDSYIKNTLAIALLLDGSKESIDKAKQLLKVVLGDRYNLADGQTMALLIYIHKLEDEFNEIESLIKRYKASYEKAQKIIEFLDIKEVAYES
ncbi:MAG: hypothetical protein RIN55_07645 [Tissierellaceae bacterium]|nr:hypothetical protein [Tissierellaceae bacterium]